MILFYMDGLNKTRNPFHMIEVHKLEDDKISITGTENNH